MNHDYYDCYHDYHVVIVYIKCTICKNSLKKMCTVSLKELIG